MVTQVMLLWLLPFKTVITVLPAAIDPLCDT